MKYIIKYQAGTYNGTRTVFADDEDEAIAKVKREIRGSMTLPMYYESYKVIDQQEEVDEY